MSSKPWHIRVIARKEAIIMFKMGHGVPRLLAVAMWHSPRHAPFLVGREMDKQDVEQVIARLPAASTTIQAAIRAGQITQTASGGGLRFETPTGTLDDRVYDVFRATDYLLSCVHSTDGTDIAFFTGKVAKTSSDGLCYHATVATNESGIRSSGLLIGRHFVGRVSKGGLYTDSKQYARQIWLVLPLVP
jgi:hypothetical protein